VLLVLRLGCVAAAVPAALLGALPAAVGSALTGMHTVAVPASLSQPGETAANTTIP